MNGDGLIEMKIKGPSSVLYRSRSFEYMDCL